MRDLSLPDRSARPQTIPDDRLEPIRLKEALR